MDKHSRTTSQRRESTAELSSLPHSLPAERSVLGAILLDNEAFHPAIELIGAGDFFLDSHRRIFARMTGLSEANQAIDLVTLSEELERSAELEAAGGSAYLSSLVDGVPRVTNIAHYARIVKEKAHRRQLVSLSQALVEDAANSSETTETLSRRAQQGLHLLSAHTRVGVWAERFRTAREIASETTSGIEWLACPWVAQGAITELAGKVKAAGKTTFVLAMVRAVLEGCPFLGHDTKKSAVVFLAEQPRASFRVALARADLLGRDDLIVLPWADTLGLSWDAVARMAAEECKRRNAGLLVVDTLAQFAGLEGDSENNAGDALAAMRPLQEAAAEGLGILVVRHERKAGGLVGDAGRGSSAYGGAVDIVLSLRRPEGNGRPTMRLIRAISRFDETPDELVIELVGGTFVARGRQGDIARQEAEEAIIAAAPRLAEEAVPLDGLIEENDTSRATAQRVVKSLVETRRLARVGSGKKGNPFRYFIPEIHSAQTSTIDGRNESEPAAERWQCPPGCNPPHTGPDEHAAAFIKALQERGFIGALQQAPAPGGVAAGGAAGQERGQGAETRDPMSTQSRAQSGSSKRSAAFDPSFPWAAAQGAVASTDGC